MTLTPEQAVEAAKLRSGGLTWKALGEHFGCDPKTVQIAIDCRFAERRKAQVKQAKRRYRRKVTVAETSVYRKIPAVVLAERDRIAAMWPTVNQAVLGDPMPGRSALDMRV